jgi:hypothetical protein
MTWLFRNLVLYSVDIQWFGTERWNDFVSHILW